MKTLARMLLIAAVGGLAMVACSRYDAGRTSSSTTPDPGTAKQATPANQPTPADQAAAAADHAQQDLDKFAREAQSKLDRLKSDAQNLIDKHKDQAASGSSAAAHDLRAAMDDARRAIGHLKDAGQATWQESKPKVDSALRELEAKIEAARARLAQPAPATQPDAQP